MPTMQDLEDWLDAVAAWKTACEDWVDEVKGDLENIGSNPQSPPPPPPGVTYGS